MIHGGDRLMLLAAISQALLTLLGAAAEETGLDRMLKANTVSQLDGLEHIGLDELSYRSLARAVTASGLQRRTRPPFLQPARGSPLGQRRADRLQGAAALSSPLA